MSEDRHADESWYQGWSRRDFLRRTGQATLATALSGGFADVFAATAAAKAGPVRGGTFRGTFGASVGFNPVVNGGTDQVSESLIFDGLISWDAGGNLFPRLAAALPTVSKDQLTYTFKLRPGIKWTDGKPLTAKDVVYTYSLMANPHYAAVQSTYRADLTTYLRSIEAPNSTTVVFKLKQPFAPFLANHGYHQIMPAHILDKLSPAEINTGPFNIAPKVSNGPFKFVEWVPNNHLTLVANKEYYGQVPYLDTLLGQFYASETDLVNAIKVGESDGGSLSQPASVLALKGVPGVTTYTISDNGLTDYFYQLDPTKSAAATIFADRNVRQALVWGLDTEGMVKSVYLGIGGATTNSIFPTVSWAYTNKTTPKYSYNPAKAAQMLAAAGWRKNGNGILEKNGKTLKFAITAPVNAQTYVEIAQVMQSNWKALGCDVSLNLIQYAQLLNAAYFTRQFDVIIPGYEFTVDPDPSRTFHSRNIYPGGFNAASYKNPTLDHLLDAAVATTNKARRTTLYHQIADIIATDVPMVPLVISNRWFAYNSHFHGLGPQNVGTFTNFENEPFWNKVWHQT